MLNEIFILNKGISKQLTTFNPVTRQKTITLAPHEKKIFAQTEDCGIIQRLWFTFSGWMWEHWNTKSIVDQTILKKLILRIYWDGNTFPSIEVPITDFFGIGFSEYKHYVSKYLALSSGGFVSYFPMPFKKGVKIELENTHDTISTDIFMNANYTKLDELPKDSGRFHAQYVQGNNSGAEKTVILNAKGKGKFIGCTLSMQACERNYLSFLEAPEFIFIDKEDTSDLTSPDIVGTGLEDYINGGWYFREGEFNSNLYGVPIKDVFNSMVSMYRFHEDDAVNFNKSIEVSFISPMDREKLKEFKYSCVTYWYQDKTVAPLKSLPPNDKLIDWYRIRNCDHLSIP